MVVIKNVHLLSFASENNLLQFVSWKHWGKRNCLVHWENASKKIKISASPLPESVNTNEDFGKFLPDCTTLDPRRQYSRKLVKSMNNWQFSISKILWAKNNFEQVEIFKGKSNVITNNWSTDRYKVIASVQFIFCFILLYIVKLPKIIIHVIGENEEPSSMYHRQT
jgi:hypothetical protein